MLQHLPSDVRGVLDEIVELGFVSVHGGQVSAVAPLGPTPNLSRWEPTLQYLQDYASFHHDWHGEFFVCHHDGWREYAPAVAESERRYAPWAEVDHTLFLGVGSKGEPRFRHRHPDPTIFPELPRPVLTYNRHVGDRNALLIPDPEFVATGFERFLNDVAHGDIPWRQKARRIMWRGGRYAVDHGGWEHDRSIAHPRALAVELSVRAQFGDILDASFEMTTIADMLKHRYQLDLDGMASAWSALFWKLSSNSVVLKLKSCWEQWFYDQLCPGTHYVPVGCIKDLPAVFADCEDQPGRCRDIVRNANRLTDRLTYEYAVEVYTIR